MVSRPRPDAPERQTFRVLTRMDRLENGSPLRSTSVTDGRTRFVGNESVLVEGSGKVSGWWIVTGTLRVIGTFQMLGNMIVEGVMTLTGEINVAAGGKITVGGMVIDPANGGSVTFPGGAVVRGGSGGGVEVRHGSYAAVVTSTGASIGESGYGFSVTDSGGHRIDGVPVSNPGALYPPGVIYMNSLGQLRRASGS